MKFTGALEGCKVLLLRPLDSNPKIRQLLESRGATVLHYPVMSIQFTSAADLERQLAKLQPVDKAIFTSSNAVLGLTRWHRFAEVFKDVPCFAVGDVTAESLASCGIQPTTAQQDKSSEGLLQLPQLQDVAKQNILLVTGENGRGLLQQVLSQRRANLVLVTVYQRLINTAWKDQIESFPAGGERGVVLLHSGELIDNLLQQVSGSAMSRLFETPVIVPGQRVAGLAREAGFKKIFTAANAIPANMVSAVEEWYSSFG